MEPLPAVNPGNVDEEAIIETFHATPMSILCQKCGNYVGLARLQGHRSFHKALSLFQYDYQTKPTSEKALNSQRVVLVKGLNNILNTSRSAYRKELAKIDLAYETLKSEMCGRMYKARTSTSLALLECNLHLSAASEVEVTLKSLKSDGRLSLGLCQSANEKWRPIMEDAYSYEGDYVFTGTTCAFFAVFDGYNGRTAATKCANQLHVVLKKNLTQMETPEDCCESGNCQLFACFQQTYDEVDKVLLQGDEETSRNRWSGCSATTCVLRGRHLHIANVGNVKGILLKGDGSVRTITEDHTPSNKKERHRIRCNGDVRKLSKTVWVNGITTTTRGLGNHGDPILKLNVINTPAVSCIPLDADDQMILLGSGGFWEVFDEDEVAVLVRDWFERKEKDGRDNGKTEGELNPSSEHLIKIKVEGVVEGMQIEPSSGLHGEKHERHRYDDKTDDGGDIACLACGNTQDSLSDGRKKECIHVDYNNESVKTNYPLNEGSSIKLCHNTTTMHGSDETKNLSTDSSNDHAGQDGCKTCLEVSKNLVRAALNSGAKDNITVMVVLVNIK